MAEIVAVVIRYSIAMSSKRFVHTVGVYSVFQQRITAVTEDSKRSFLLIPETWCLKVHSIF